MERNELTITARAPTQLETLLYLEECRLKNGGRLCQGVEPMFYDYYPELMMTPHFTDAEKLEIVQKVVDNLKELRQKFKYKSLFDDREDTDNSEETGRPQRLLTS